MKLASTSCTAVAGSNKEYLSLILVDVVCVKDLLEIPCIALLPPLVPALSAVVRTVLILVLYDVVSLSTYIQPEICKEPDYIYVRKR